MPTPDQVRGKLSPEHALTNPFVRLRLWGPARRLCQRAQNAAPCQLDLEVVVAEAARIAQDGIGGAQEALPRCRRPTQQRLGFTVAPRLVRDNAAREPRLPALGAFDP